MEYYKIIRNGAVTGAGQMFLKWYSSKHSFMYCDLNSAELVQDVITDTIYHAYWLRNVPQEAGAVEEAEVVMINAAEYDEIIEQLREGEEILAPEPDPEPEPEPVEPDPEPEPERPMTIAEMRAAIADLTAMTAKEDIAKWSYFVLHDEVYRAVSPIRKGTEIRPGYNCEKKTLDEVIT